MLKLKLNFYNKRSTAPAGAATIAHGAGAIAPAVAPTAASAAAALTPAAPAAPAAAVATGAGSALIPFVEDEDGWDATLKSNPGTVIAVQFTASWCGPCKNIGPKFQEMSGKYTNILYKKIDVDDNEEIQEKCEVKQMPTFMFYKDGEKLFEFTGDKPDMLKLKLNFYNKRSTAPSGGPVAKKARTDGHFTA